MRGRRRRRGPARSSTARGVREPVARGSPRPRPCSAIERGVDAPRARSASVPRRPSSSSALDRVEPAPRARSSAVVERRPSAAGRRAARRTPGDAAQRGVDRSTTAARRVDARRRASAGRGGSPRAGRRARQRRRRSVGRSVGRRSRRRPAASRPADRRPTMPHIDGEVYGGLRRRRRMPRSTSGRRRRSAAASAAVVRSAPRPSPAPAARCRDGRTSTRPSSPSSASTAATSARRARSATSSVAARRPRTLREHLRQPGHRRRPARTSGRPGAAHDVEQQEPGEQAVAGGGEVAEDHVARLLAAERRGRARSSAVEHVAVADRRLDHARCRARASARRKPEVRHHRDHDRVVARARPRSCRSMRARWR